MLRPVGLEMGERGTWELHFRLRQGPEEGWRGELVSFENVEEKSKRKL